MTLALILTLSNPKSPSQASGLSSMSRDSREGIGANSPRAFSCRYTYIHTYVVPWRVCLRVCMCLRACVCRQWRYRKRWQFFLVFELFALSHGCGVLWMWSATVALSNGCFVTWLWSAMVALCRGMLTQNIQYKYIYQRRLRIRQQRGGGTRGGGGHGRGSGE